MTPRLTHVARHVIGLAGEEGKTVVSRSFPPTAQDYQLHFLGQVPLGVVPDQGNNFSSWFVLDCDDDAVSIETAKALFAPLLSDYVGCHVEPGLTRGWRFYLFLSEEVSRKRVMPLLHWVNKFSKTELELFPKGMRTITVPGYGIPDFEEKLADMRAGAWSLCEVYAQMQMLDWTTSEFFEVPCLTRTDDTFYRMVKNSTIQDSTDLAESFRYANMMLLLNPHSETDMERIYRSGSRAETRISLSFTETGAETREFSGGFEIFKNCVQDVVQIVGDAVTFRFTVKHPTTQETLLLDFPASLMATKAGFRAKVWGLTGYKYAFPDDAQGWDAWTDEWFRAEQQKQPFEFTRAGMLLRNLITWILQTPLRTKEEIQQKATGGQFLHDQKLYVHADVLTQFMGNTTYHAFGLKLEEIPLLTRKLVSEGRVKEVSMYGQNWLELDLQTNHLQIMSPMDGGRFFLDQVDGSYS